MSSFETPPDQPEKKDETVKDLYQEGSREQREALYRFARNTLRENGPGEFREETKAAVAAWQKVVEQMVKIQNDSLGNIETVVRRAELFLETGRYQDAWDDISDAKIAAVYDNSLPVWFVRKIESLEREIQEHLRNSEA